MVALHPGSCLAEWSSVRKFLDATLKKINAESNPNVCHPVFRKFRLPLLARQYPVPVLSRCDCYIWVRVCQHRNGLISSSGAELFFRSMEAACASCCWKLNHL